MENNDKISQLYYGQVPQLFSEGARDEARARVHWICEKAEGKKVIDIGCSQGIASILLAREGFQVVGVDTDAEAIKYANSDMAKEPPEVQQRLTFARGNIHDIDLPGREFHTAIMGEFLEHQVRPDKAVSRAYELLVDDGRLIITVPFGLYESPDHKQTFYIASLYRLIHSHFVISEAEIIGKHLCLLCKKRQTVLEKQTGSIDLALVERAEREFQQIEVALTRERDAKKKEAEKVKSEREALAAELDTRKKEAEKVKAEWEALAAELDTSRKEAEKVKSERETLVAGLAATGKEAEKVKSERETLVAGLAATRKEAEKVKSEREALAAELSTNRKEAEKFKAEREALAAELDTRKKEAEKFKAELNTTKAELNTTKREITRLQAELAKGKRKLQAVRSSFSFQLGSMLIQAVRKPGRNTIFLPYRVFRLGVKAVRKKPGPLSPPSTSKAVTTVSPESKPIVLPVNKAHIMAEIRERIAAVKRNIGAGAPGHSEPRRKDLKIAVIMDKFTYDCFKYEANLITFTPDNWKQVLSVDKPDFLLVESAWQGNDKSWRYQIVNLGQKPRSQLPELVQWCKIQNIPTAFWSKEDPGHYNDFLDAATLFDYIYTTDSECIPRYKDDLKHDNVFCLPFAAQPRIHNPIGSGQKIGDVAFAGAWYASESEDKKHRREQMANVLAPALLYDVDIYDRNFALKDDMYRFPEQYQPYIVGELPYEEMVYAYKMYNIFLNVSSVSDSPSFLPRRVFEILASGTCVLSGYCKGIENMLGSDIVPMSSSPQETELLLKKLLEDKELRDRLACLGLRKVMREHTYEKRLAYILQTMGIRQNDNGVRKEGVSIITCTNKLIYVDNIFANYDRQEYDEKELIIILNNNLLDMGEWMEEARKHHNVTVYRVDEKEGLGACLNFGVDKARFEHIAKFDDDDYYAPAYLEEMVNTFNYSGADVVGKCTRYLYFEKDKALTIRFPDKEFQYTHLVAGATIIVHREVFDKVKFITDKVPGVDTRFLKDCLANGFKIFSAGRFNFVGARRISKDMHTWKIADEEAKAASEIIVFTDNYVPYITC